MAMETDLTQKIANEKFSGKRIKKLKVEALNQLRFLFEDGTQAVLHLEASMGLPVVQYCEGC